MNEKRLNELFKETDIKFDTSSYSKYIPLFQQKLGPKKPLRLQTSAKDITVKFG